MFEKFKRKSFDEMTIVEKDAEIKRLENLLKFKKILYWISVPLTVISVISNVLIVVMVCIGGEKLYSIDPILNKFVIVFILATLVSMLLCVHFFVIVYWIKFIKYAYEFTEEYLSGDIYHDIIIGGIGISIPTAIVIAATFITPGFYCIKRTFDLKKSIKELAIKIKAYKLSVCPLEGDFKLINSYKM